MKKSKVLLIAGLITVAQIAVMFAVQPIRTKNNPPYAYQHLFQWDSVHYQTITDEGYSEKTAGFFPAYPISSRLLSFVMPSKYALIITAQLACLIFWYYFILALLRWKIPIALPISLVIAHPASFYLVSAYSEAIFCAALMCFIYSVYSSRTITALISGVVLGLSRIVGFPMALLPLIISKTRIAAVAPIIGISIYFTFLYFQFGYWDQFFITQHTGWGLKANYFFFLDPPSWLFLPWTFEPNTYLDYTGSIVSNDVNTNNRWIAAITFYLLILSSIFGKKIIILCAWGFFYVILAGVIDNDLQSFTRYALVVHILIVLAIGHRLKSYWWWLIPITISPLMIFYANRFIEGGWVA